VTRRGHRLPALTLAALLGVSGLALSTARPASVQAGGAGLLPDLAMAPLSDFTIQWVGGRRLLRFTVMMVNVGDGHFELRGSRSSTSQPMHMSQVVYETTARNSPIAQQFMTDAVASYAGDGHNHWHVDEMMRYDAWGSTRTLRGAKVGFCILDSDPWNLSLPGEVGPYYRGTMCSTNPSALSNRMGISVGWGDEYEYYLAWQWVDITGLPGGTYTVRAKVDPNGFFLEKDETNQCAWARLSLSGSSSAVSVLGRGTTCVTDYDESIYAGDIAWAYATGVTRGCAPDLFCPQHRVTREQVASLLARALSLPPPTRDWFTDDNGRSHEGDINRLAEAGITRGCTAGRFCPASPITREQMASLLVRAYGLPASAQDYFTDDADSIHQGSINALAASGITGGCAAGRYCPRAAVTRGQMVAFLHRAER
jgi:hypothetical protein